MKPATGRDTELLGGEGCNPDPGPVNTESQSADKSNSLLCQRSHLLLI